MRSLYTSFLAVAIAMALGGCGGGTGEEADANASAHVEPDRSASTEKVPVTLHQIEGPDDLGLLMAEKQGYLEEAGLDVRIAAPVGVNRAVSAVAKGEDDFGIVPMPQVVIAKEEGRPIVAVGSVIPLATATIIWTQGSGIPTAANLKGKTIAVPRVPYLEGLLRAVLSHQGLSLGDVKVERIDSGLVPALASGRADAIFGASLNDERIELEAQKLKLVVKSAAVLGIPPYEESVMVSRPALVANDPQLVREIMGAVAKGATAALEDPQASAGLIAETESPPPAGAVAKTQAETTGLMLSRTGHMDLNVARKLIDWMYDQHLIREKLPVATVMTNTLG
ncbi:MAG TPA: ABC transporter substrate-binding protein [Solirubrobacterales bacterium]|jgi:putative hydroxymethylpyrimidine transport system substrate-binding protein|nr:ABC transporter substrate-binding protein [Solirubrobacterales bacterium]